ncbi:hypothetical protein SCUP515_01568 [Seiridium cupressi]
MASNSGKGLLLDAIDKADAVALRLVLKSMCNSSEECHIEAAKLLLTKKRKSTGGSGQSNSSSKKQKSDDILISRYEKCSTCKEVFDVTDNCEDSLSLPSNLRKPTDILEVDPEYFPDDDDTQAGDIDVDDDWRVEEFPEGFEWQCCGEPANGKPCQGIDRRDLESSAAVHAQTIPISDDLSPHTDVVTKREMIPDIDLDSLVDKVWDKAKGKFDDAAADFKKGFEGTVDAAEKAFNDAVDAAKKTVNDIKDAVEKVWEDIQEQISELKDKAAGLIHDWIHEHIVEPLIKILIVLAVIFSFLPVWYLLHLVAKPFVRTGKAKPRTTVNIELPPWPATHSPKESKEPGKGWAYYVVRSWEKYGQGVVCFMCPFISGFVSWLNARKVPKLEYDVRKLRLELEDLKTRLEEQRAQQQRREKQEQLHWEETRKELMGKNEHRTQGKGQERRQRLEKGPGIDWPLERESRHNFI